MYNDGKKAREIADVLKVSNATVYSELHMGMIEGKYNAYFAQKNRNKKKSHKKGHSKINSELAEYISILITKDHLSPKKIIEKLNNEKYPQSPSSVNTIYKAIDEGIIPNVTRKSMQRKVVHMFSKRMIIIPNWICEELQIADGNALNIEIEDNKIIITKSDDNKQ